MSSASAAGAVGAFALALLSVAAAVLQIAGRLPAAAAAPVTPLATAAVLAAAGLAQAAAARGASAALRPPTPVARGAEVVAWVGAALLLGAAGALTARSAWGVRLAEFAPVAQGFWALGVVAVAWRLKRWPAWLRVTGAVWGAAAAILPGAPVLNAPVLLVGLAWWPGLGAALLRAERSTLG